MFEHVASFSVSNFGAWWLSSRLVQLQREVDLDLFVCFGAFRVPDEDPENTLAACSLLQLSRNTSHTQYMCNVDMTVLLADVKVQVDVTEVADGQHVISKGFYMGNISKYKHSGFDKCCLSARVVWARRECGSQRWGAVFGVRSPTQSTVLMSVLLQTTETLMPEAELRASLASAFLWGNSFSPRSNR